MVVFTPRTLKDNELKKNHFIDCPKKLIFKVFSLTVIKIAKFRMFRILVEWYLQPVDPVLTINFHNCHV